MENLQIEYNKLLNSQKFDESNLNYSIFEDRHKPFLEQMAKVNNSAVSVFDLNKKEHIYNSFNTGKLFSSKEKIMNVESYNNMIHTDDLIDLTKIGIVALAYILDKQIEDRQKYKLQNEYRIKGTNNEYIRVIEQFQVLELDTKGNIWLSLSTYDISPNQNNHSGVISQLLNLDSNKIERLYPETIISEGKLTLREKEVLSLIDKGYQSKEISDNLIISLHTVNKHRQNILKKFGVQNSLEALNYARKYNLIDS